MRPWLCAFTGIRPLAYHAPPPVVRHVYLHLHKLQLITGAYAQAGGGNMLQGQQRAGTVGGVWHRLSNEGNAV